MSRCSSTVAFLMCLASLVAVPSSVSASDLNKTIDLWMNEAPITHVIHQLAELGGGHAKITGSVEGRVSGRFSGTVADTLKTLSEEHDVLFDLQGDTLNATSKRALSEVSMVMAGAELNDTLKSSMQKGLMPGNAIDIQDELVKLSGHPDFVKRTARQLAAELAITRAAELEKSAQEESAAAETLVKVPTTTSRIAEPEKTVQVLEEPETTLQVLEEPLATEQDPVVVESEDSSPAEPLVVEVEAPMIEPEVAEETVLADVIDKGSDAIRVDIAEDDAVDSKDVTNNDSIRWVTDIPGFSTF